MDETRRIGGWWQHVWSHSATPTDRRNKLRFLAWVFAWMAAFLLVTWILRSDSPPTGATAWLLALAPNVLGIIAALSYVRFLRDADELVRRIQLEGLAIGFGIGAVFGIGYQLAERAGAPEIATGDVVAVMAIAWGLGQLVAAWRYR